MVYLVMANSSNVYAKGFKAGGAMDATVVLYTIAYFATCGFTASAHRAESYEDTPQPAH